MEGFDKFGLPSPFPSWVLDEDTGIFVAPTPHPEGLINYMWVEETQEWIPFDEWEDKQ
jgi:hypothetical protein